MEKKKLLERVNPYIIDLHGAPSDVSQVSASTPSLLTKIPDAVSVFGK
jgi:hypothetical protein